MTFKPRVLNCLTCKTKTRMFMETLDIYDYSENPEQGCIEFRVIEWECAGCHKWEAHIMLDRSETDLRIS